MRAAAIQLNSNADGPRDIELAERLVRAAVKAGAELLALPEKWSLLGPGELLAERAEDLDGTAARAAAGWARELGVWILAGSIAERLEGNARVANTSLLFGPDGTRVAAYRKIHMFDVDVGGVSYRESAHEQAGSEIVAADLEDARLGMTVCYDLRFPELYRSLALDGARLVTVPSAFTVATGRDHWEVLLRARAIENQFFVVAPNQWGEAPPHYDSWGHSMIIDPWGRILDQCASGEGFAIADLDFGELERIRAELPSLANRRGDAYRSLAMRSQQQESPGAGAHA